jgi:hypothetical protein
MSRDYSETLGVVAGAGLGSGSGGANGATTTSALEREPGLEPEIELQLERELQRLVVQCSQVKGDLMLLNGTPVRKTTLNTHQPTNKNNRSSNNS